MRVSALLPMFEAKVSEADRIIFEGWTSDLCGGTTAGIRYADQTATAFQMAKGPPRGGDADGLSHRQINAEAAMTAVMLQHMTWGANDPAVSFGEITGVLSGFLNEQAKNFYYG